MFHEDAAPFVILPANSFLSTGIGAATSFFFYLPKGFFPDEIQFYIIILFPFSINTKIKKNSQHEISSCALASYNTYVGAEEMAVGKNTLS
uniref:Uncharacterized protein n=1 Tax=Octopus bimaculoides TaxID=37653 RepID=A0A0L8HPY9_OCTBM